MNSGCTNSKFDGVRELERTTGQSVRTRIRERRRGGAIRGGLIIRVRHVQSSGKAHARAATCANTRTACSSAGFTRRDTARNYVKMVPRAIAGLAFSHTTRRSCACRRMRLGTGSVAKSHRTRRRRRGVDRRRTVHRVNRAHRSIGR